MKQTSRLLGLALVLGLAILLAGCEPSVDSDTLSTSPTPDPRVEQQAVDNLLQLYGQALQHEDIDRLQALLEPAPPPSILAGSVSRQGAADLATDLAAFRQTLSTTFRGQTGANQWGHPLAEVTPRPTAVSAMSASRMPS